MVDEGAPKVCASRTPRESHVGNFPRAVPSHLRTNYAHGKFSHPL
jgi:hypothetical protein